MRAIDRVAGRPGAAAVYGLLALDLAALGWVVLESFLPEGPVVFAVDIALGLVLAAELVVRLRAARSPWREIAHPTGLADLLAVASFLIAPFFPGWGFLRLLRPAGASSACSGRCDCCARRACWRICGATCPASAATRRRPAPRLTFWSSCW